MTLNDPRLVKPGSTPEPAENVQDVIPPTERNQDPLTTEVTHGLTLDGSRPLTDEERKAADRDTPVGERVYAPASERVPVEPVPGHREVVEHPDTHTPEREAAAMSTPSSSGNPGSEPTFTRVARPSTTYGSDTPTPGAYASPMSNPAWDHGYSAVRDDSRRRTLFMGIGFSWFTVICTGVGVWLFMRWRNERNKPINRIRRRAEQAASEIRERVPSPDEAARPVMGLTTAVLSILLVLWRQAQANAKHADKRMRRGAEKMSDADWQKRLTKLKERWNPGRLELEKISISRH
jgi:hypothetical protein